MSEQRKYRTFTAQQKLEIVVAGLRGDVTVKELCRQHEIAETLYYSWREKLLEGGREALAGKAGAAGRAGAEAADRPAGAGARPQDLRVGDRGGTCRGGGSERARRPLPRTGRCRPQAGGGGARAPGQSAGDLRKPKPRRPPQRRPAVPVRSTRRSSRSPTQTRPTAPGWSRRSTSRGLGRPVNRKRAQRVMREQRLLQRTGRPAAAAARLLPGRAARPALAPRPELVWVAEHGWCYLQAAIDCCTREIVGWSLELRCRTEEATTLVEQASLARGIEPGELTLGTDNGSAFTSRALPRPPRRARHHPPPRRLPRPREPGLHRNLVRQAQGAARLALRVRDPRPGEKGDRRLHRQLPPPPALRPPLPDPGRGPADLGGWTATSENSGLKCQPRGVQATRAQSVRLREFLVTCQARSRPRPVKWCTRLTASSSPDVHAAWAIAITSSGSSAGSASALVIESALM